jgi:hypothetical protein
VHHEQGVLAGCGHSAPRPALPSARNRVSLDPAMSLAAICPTLASLGAVDASR